MVVGVDGVNRELCGVAVVSFLNCLVVSVDFLCDLLFFEFGVDGDGVWCVCDSFCRGCNVW